jgi:hypothetical protein
MMIDEGRREEQEQEQEQGQGQGQGQEEKWGSERRLTVALLSMRDIYGTIYTRALFSQTQYVRQCRRRHLCQKRPSKKRPSTVSKET